MKPRGTRPWGVIASCLAIATVGGLLATRLVDLGPRPPRQSATANQSSSTLPPGVCPFAVGGLPVAQATKIEAKLVTFDVALASDPIFPFRGSLEATGTRIQEPIRVANYFWVVAAAGNFNLDFPRPPETGPGVGSFKCLVFYLPADRCDMPGGHSTQGLGAWPAWFDGVTGLSDINIK